MKLWLMAIVLLPLFVFSSISEKDLAEIRPALMPDDHPIKAELDTFFSERRWTFSPSSMKKGGFSTSKPRPFSHIVVAKNPRFPGYIFKVCLDVQRLPSDKEDYFLWKKRVDGIERIRKIVLENGWQETFAMPRKWIYILPETPKCRKGYIPKYSILVAEDVHLLPEVENKKFWASDQITHEMLDRLYAVLKGSLLGDCTIIINIPINEEGKISFIDTQIWGSKNINWYYLNKALNLGNKAYWKKITHQK